MSTVLVAVSGCWAPSEVDWIVAVLITWCLQESGSGMHAACQNMSSMVHMYGWCTGFSVAECNLTYFWY
jgi:hypothetical protein